MKRIYLLLLICTFSMAAMATSTPSGDKERARKGEVSPGMANPSPATLQGELTEDMLAQEAAVEQEVPVTASIPKTSETPIVAHKVSRVAKSKKESRFLKRVEKVRKRIFRRGAEGGGAALGIIALVFGILGFFALIAAPFAAIAAASAGWIMLALSGMFGLLAIVLGAVGMGGSDSGKAFGVAGLVIGIVGTSIFLIALMIALLISAI